MSADIARRSSSANIATMPTVSRLARDLGGKKPLEAIPLAKPIAGATVETFEQR
jgi:hypothetical protein